MRVLITGVAGFLGSHLSDECQKRGWEVTGVDNFFRGKPENVENSPNLSLIEMDICGDLGKLERLISEERPEVVFHYGAINGTEYFYESPWEVIENNTFSTINLLKAINKSTHTPKRIVYASSSEVYGEFPEEIPTNENAITRLDINSIRDSYASSKSIGDFLVRNFCESKEIGWSILRIFNCYGPRMDSSKFGQVVPEFISRAINGEEFTIIGDGTQTRSFCYVDDHVRMVADLVDFGADDGVYNIGNNEEVSMLNLAKKIHEKLEIGFEPVFLPPRSNDPPRRVPDCTKIGEISGNEMIGLDVGIEKTVAWYLSQEN